MRLPLFLSLVCLLSSASAAQEPQGRPASSPKIIAATPAKAPNSHALYQQVRNVALSGESSSAANLVLKRDAATFTFKRGDFHFLAPVNGKVTGAVFIGDGSFDLVPPTNSEKRSVSLLTREPVVREEFTSLVLRFTDKTYDEIVAASPVKKGSPAGQDELNEINNALRKRHLINYNLAGRLLQDVMSDRPGRLFFAFIKGRKYNSKELFAIDPRGALGFEPEEVVFQTWDESRYGVWASFHFAEEYAAGKATSTQWTTPFDIQSHAIEAQVEKSARLSGSAITTFVVKEDGLQVLPFDLFPTLRVENVTGLNGEALDFIQEDKNEDADFYVVLPKPLKSGETYSLRTGYSGKDAVSNEEGGNYYPVARSNWYPNSRFGDYADYQMRFKVPKGLTLVAAGVKTSATNEGDWEVTQWQSPTPQTVAGFNMGRFKHEARKLNGMDFEVDSYANTELPGFIKEIQHEVEAIESEGGAAKTARPQVNATLGSISMTDMMKKASGEGEYAVRLFTDYFGPIPYKNLYMTQQTAGNYGQAWPGLVYMPLTSFLDSTIRFQLTGFDPKGYFRVVGPHEVAHQWWGHTVGYSSYRDQWMSEGFSDLSASLFIQMVAKNNQEFIRFWNDQREYLTMVNQAGFRPIDIGPVTMGYRVASNRTGFDAYRRLIYPKGSYILHMIRMMMWDRKTGDENFKVTMRDFVKTYTGKPASTEDFKAMVEKHMTPEMDLDGNRKMDWFFDPYVYGTVLPSYRFEHSIQNGVLSFKITQSKVPNDFKMPVPVYVELMDGRVSRLGSANIMGNTTVEQSIPLGQLKVKRAMLMYYNDVLGIIEK
jgi:hypothetical protein